MTRFNRGGGAQRPARRPATQVSINGTTAVPGIVDGVQTNDGTVYLTVDGSEVPLSSVTNAVKPTASN